MFWRLFLEQEKDEDVVKYMDQRYSQIYMYWFSQKNRSFQNQGADFFSLVSETVFRDLWETK